MHSFEIMLSKFVKVYFKSFGLHEMNCLNTNFGMNLNISEPLEAECVLGWCLPKDYQKLESPQPDSPVHVKINVEILDILSVNDKEFSITMSMYFR